MKKISFIKGDYCIHCDRAFNYMTELYTEDDRYKKLKIEIIDEILNSDIADEYDFLIVPVLAVDGEIITEGPTTKDMIKKVFEKALESDA